MAKIVLINTNFDIEFIFGIHYTTSMPIPFIFLIERALASYFSKNELFQIKKIKIFSVDFFLLAAIFIIIHLPTQRPQSRLLRYLPFARYYNYPHPEDTTVMTCCVLGAFSHSARITKKRKKR